MPILPILAGIVAALALGLTTDQIIQRVYDSANTAMRVNVVAGSAGGSPAGNVNDLQINANGTDFGAYAGDDCGAGNYVQALDSAGQATCAAASAGSVTGSGTTGLIPQWSGAAALTDSTSYRISVTNDTVTGTTTNKLVKLTSTGTAIITSAAETAGILGVCVSGCGTTGSAVIALIGNTTCNFTNATTAGNYAIASATVAGDCQDSGSTTFPAAGTQVLGVITATGAAGNRATFLATPDVASAASGGGGGGAKNPAGAAGDVQYRASTNAFAAESAFNYSASTDNLVLANATTSSNNAIALNATTVPTGNIAYAGRATGAATGDNYGGVFQASGTSGRSIATFGKAAGTAAGDNIGVLGNAANSTEATNLKNVAVYGTLNSSLITGVNGSFAGLFDGGTLPDANSQVLRLRGTLANANGSVGVYNEITSAGSTGTQGAMYSSLAAGYTGSGQTYGVIGNNDALSTGTTLNIGAEGTPTGNMGVWGQIVSAGSTGNRYAVYGEARGSTTQNFGVFGKAADDVAGTMVGVFGSASTSTEATDLKNVGGYFTLNSTLITGANISVALLAQNTGTDDIFRGYNGTSLMFRMEDTGEFTSAGTSTIGWSVVTGADTACTTTCTSACVAGFANDVSGMDIVACSDTSADACLCAGAS